MDLNDVVARVSRQHGDPKLKTSTDFGVELRGSAGTRYMRYLPQASVWVVPHHVGFHVDPYLGGGRVDISAWHHALHRSVTYQAPGPADYNTLVTLLQVAGVIDVEVQS